MTSSSPHGEGSVAHQGDGGGSAGGPRRSPAMWAVLALAVAGILIYLVVDHWPHVLAALPYVGIVALVAMHLFGHGGHGGQGGHGGHGGHGRAPADGPDRT
ncbi:DUF2933 domain-containing protein [Microbacterium sp. Mu-80]|uniref:DUF2933 domain-containing protein n=1 Tax=Microbacterium bandirmense TaxID=3122050 RepID=A0ABU8L9L1_9MICO